MANFSSSFSLPTPTLLNALEQRLGVSLPSDYRQFLSCTNGGIPEPDRHFQVPSRGDVMLGTLYGVGPDGAALDLEYEQEQAAMWEPLPPGSMAVGDYPGGNLLLLSTVGQDAGRVWFWDRVGM